LASPIIYLLSQVISQNKIENPVSLLYLMMTQVIPLDKFVAGGTFSVGMHGSHVFIEFAF
jgi:hypothetical protein